jgi:hypothetical protein
MGRTKQYDDCKYYFDPKTQVQDVVCAKCKKIFVPAAYHVYTENHRFYCSWTCYNHRKEK